MIKEEKSRVISLAFQNWGNINIELNILRLICASYWLASYVFVVDLNFRKRLLAILFFFLLFLLHWYTVMLDLNWRDRYITPLNVSFEIFINQILG